MHLPHLMLLSPGPHQWKKLIGQLPLSYGQSGSSSLRGWWGKRRFLFVLSLNRHFLRASRVPVPFSHGADSRWPVWWGPCPKAGQMRRVFKVLHGITPVLFSDSHVKSCEGTVALCEVRCLRKNDGSPSWGCGVGFPTSEGCGERRECVWFAQG